jgi:hypothetical protein
MYTCTLFLFLFAVLIFCLLSDIDTNIDNIEIMKSSINIVNTNHLQSWI